MGGLVARAFIEGDDYCGGVDHFVMLATPNRGSTWATYRVALEVEEHFHLWQHEDDWHWTWMITDGLGEAGRDLKPRSKFLTKLNARPRREGVKYTVVAGSQHPASRITARYIDKTSNLIRGRAANWWGFRHAKGGLDRAADRMANKTGKSDGYGEFPQEDAPGTADLTDRGRRLQLPLYAVAARRELGQPDSEVEAYYSFVDEGGTRRGGVVGAAEHGRLLEVLDTVTGGMAEGVAPARPGAYNAYYRSFDNCGFCPYDRTCSAGRDEQWEAVRDDARVAPYAQLAEGDA